VTLETLSQFLVFFSAEHLIRSLIAGVFVGWIGQALYYIATKSRWRSAALKVAGIVIALYGSAHAVTAIGAMVA